MLTNIVNNKANRFDPEISRISAAEQNSRKRNMNISASAQSLDNSSFNEPTIEATMDTRIHATTTMTTRPAAKKPRNNNLPLDENNDPDFVLRSSSTRKANQAGSAVAKKPDAQKKTTQPTARPMLSINQEELSQHPAGDADFEVSTPNQSVAPLFFENNTQLGTNNNTTRDANRTFPQLEVNFLVNF